MNGVVYFGAAWYFTVRSFPDESVKSLSVTTPDCIDQHVHAAPNNLCVIGILRENGVDVVYNSNVAASVDPLSADT